MSVPTGLDNYFEYHALLRKCGLQMYKLFEEKKNYLPMLTIRFWLTSKVQGNPAKKKISIKGKKLRRPH